MSERCHYGRYSKGVGYLINCSKPGSDICQALRGREGEDGLSELSGWFNTCVSDQESQKSYLAFTKLELFWVECAATP